jgi:actin-related protein
MDEDQLQRQSERRHENAQRLKELAAKNRTEQLQAKKELYAQLMELQSNQSSMDQETFLSRLADFGYIDEADFKDQLMRLKRSLVRGGHLETDKKPMSFELVDIPDAGLDDVQKKEKKKQKLLKAGHDARERANITKQLEQDRQAMRIQKEAEMYLQDPEVWLTARRNEYKELHKRIKEREKTGVTGRRTAASAGRMQLLANLADAGSTKKRKKELNDDMFGVDDADWLVYRDISKDDKSDDDEDTEALTFCEMLLERFDADFNRDDVEERTAYKLLAHYYGHPPSSIPEPQQAHQLHLNVERIRVPEALFQPEIVGLDQAGLDELMDIMLKRLHGHSLRDPIAQNIFVTGGFSNVQGLDERIHASIQALLPAGSTVNVLSSPRGQRALDAWQGASIFAQDSENHRHYLTRQQYHEMGADYIVEHVYGNRMLY